MVYVVMGILENGVTSSFNNGRTVLDCTPSFMIAARNVFGSRLRDVSIATGVPVRVFLFNSFIETVYGVLMIPVVLQESAYMCFTSIQIQLSNGDVQRDNLQFKTVDLLVFFRFCRSMR